jgi:hypothetical protein
MADPNWIKKQLLFLLSCCSGTHPTFSLPTGANPGGQRLVPCILDGNCFSRDVFLFVCEWNFRMVGNVYGELAIAWNNTLTGRM